MPSLPEKVRGAAILAAYKSYEDEGHKMLDVDRDAVTAGAEVAYAAGYEAGMKAAEEVAQRQALDANKKRKSPAADTPEKVARMEEREDCAEPTLLPDGAIDWLKRTLIETVAFATSMRAMEGEPQEASEDELMLQGILHYLEGRPTAEPTLPEGYRIDVSEEGVFLINGRLAVEDGQGVAGFLPYPGNKWELQCSEPVDAALLLPLMRAAIDAMEKGDG